MGILQGKNILRYISEGVLQIFFTVYIYAAIEVLADWTDDVIADSEAAGSIFFSTFSRRILMVSKYIFVWLYYATIFHHTPNVQIQNNLSIQEILFFSKSIFSKIHLN